MAAIKRPKVHVTPPAQHHALPDERIIIVSSDGGGCLMSMRVIDGRLRIEVYRADDTVDVVAPGHVLPVRDSSWLDDRPRTPTARRAMEGA